MGNHKQRYTLKKETRAMADFQVSNFKISFSKVLDNITLNEREEQELRVTQESVLISYREAATLLN